jgi:hypothetical protein
MSRDLRYFTPFSLVEVTDVTFQNRYLLRPSDELNDIVVGVFGRAQARFGMIVCGLTVLSTHWHALLVPRDAEHLADFMEYVNGNLSKEVGLLHDWSGSLWNDRYHLVVVSDEEEAQVGRLKYLLANGVKEFLVDRVLQWPGVHSASALMHGEPLVGNWYSRTKEYAARQLRREKNVDPEDFATEYELKLSPLPCWRDQYGEAEVRQQVTDLVEKIEEEGAQDRRAKKKTSLGVKKILRMKPHYKPKNVEKSEKPRFHAVARQAAIKLLLEGYMKRLSPTDATPPPQPLARRSTGCQRVRRAHHSARPVGRYCQEGTFPPALSFVAFPESVIVARGFRKALKGSP